MSGLSNLGAAPTASIGDHSASTRILLWLDHEPNRDRLAEWLTAEYEVHFPETTPPEELQFDLCILDEPILVDHRDQLQSMKERAGSVFLPFLLVSSGTTETAANGRVWTAVDEVISIPAQKAMLHNRLTNLLERRELSQQLADDLDQQRALFENIFDSSNDAIFVIDPDGETIRECNPQACDLFGYTREELLSLSAEDIHPDERALFRGFLETVLEDGHGWTEELTCLTKDGARLDAEISASAIEIEGRPHMLASVRDVTTRTEQRAVLNSLHDVTAELMWAQTQQAVAEVALDAVQQVFEYDIAGVRLLNDTTDPETLNLVAATSETYDLLNGEPTAYEPGEGLVGQSFELGEATTIDDLQCGTVPFDYGPIQSAMCFPLGDHGVLNVGATDTAAFETEEFQLTKILATNVTAALTRARREQELSDRTEQLSALFENTTDAIVTVIFDDGTPTIGRVNSVFERVFGHDSDEIQGDSLQELVVPPDGHPESQTLVEHACAGEPIETEARRETATGRRDFRIQVVPIQDERSAASVYVVYTDITERRRRDEQLQVLNRVLRHNIRNKLNVVRGTIEKTLETEDTVPRTLAQNGLEAVDELLSLSETARELSNSTQPEGDLDPVSVPRVVNRTVESVAQEYPAVEITTDILANGWVVGTVQLDCAVRELCENAIEHSDRAVPAVSITVEGAAEPAEWLDIIVADDGPGIPADQQAVLEDGKETALKHCNGLGLWAVHWIITSAGGELSLKNTDNGAVVTMSVPTVEPNKQPRTGIDGDARNE